MASGDDLWQWRMGDADIPETNGAARAVRGDRVVVKFDSDNDQYITFSVMKPENYGGNGITLRLAWTQDGGGSGNVEWTCEVASYTDDATDSINSPSYDTLRSVVGGAPSLDFEVVYDEIVLNDSDLDGVADREMMEFRIGRDADDVTNDTLDENAYLILIAARET